MCETMKSTICKAYGVLLLAGTLLMAACDDWTMNEKIGIDEPQFGERNPELHARYLESLRAYKAGEHIRTYVWFDNTEKLPASRGGFFADVPDSVDVVVLTAPGRLTASELEQVAELRGKGTRVIGAVDCTALLAQWEASQPQEPETPATEVNDGGEGATGDPQPAGDGFAAWLGERLGERIDEIEADALDGLTICYEPRETIFMTDAERAVQAAREAVVVAAMKRWTAENPDGLLLFEGNPQNLTDKSVLAACDRLVVRCLGASTLYDFGTLALRLCDDGVPADRFLWLVSAVKPASADFGYVTDASGASVRAVGALAGWMLQPGELAKTAIGIYNVQYDYYNSSMIYRYTKQAIDMLNPSPKN